MGPPLRLNLDKPKSRQNFEHIDGGTYGMEVWKYGWLNKHPHEEAVVC